MSAGLKIWMESEPTRVYIIVDDRLYKSQRIPQAAHAMAELMREFG